MFLHLVPADRVERSSRRWGKHERQRGSRGQTTFRCSGRVTLMAKFLPWPMEAL